MAEEKSFDATALEYHRSAPPGKLAIQATKPLANQRDLALAYSPGVAAACRAIVDDPLEASRVTARGNLVAVISNGTAVLGLGNIGPLAAKPVMEGKAVLFKKFAGIDVFDLEVAQEDPRAFIETVAALEPTFGAVNLEDIKAPECFEIEEALRARMAIPVFHDDQHGTAIIVAAAVENGLTLNGKRLHDIRVAGVGAGAAAIACLDLLVSMGLRRENITICDREGVLTPDRLDSLHPRQRPYARQTTARTLAEAMAGADLFLGLAGPDLVTAEMVKAMAKDPLIFALANPTPEIMPTVAREARPDAIIATGRSDFPNQVNNVLCFPFIFRGALDVGAREIDEAMKIACVHALAELTRETVDPRVTAAYGEELTGFGPDYLIPKPFDPRLIVRLAPAVARAAMDSGLADRPIADMAAYRQQLQDFVYRSGLVMKPVFDKAKEDPRRVVYAEGEDERVLRAAQTVVDEGLATPIIVGRRRVVEMRLQRAGLRLRMDTDFELVDPESDPRYREYWTLYYQLMARKGGTPDVARTVVRTSTTAIAALMVRRGEAEAMVCGVIGQYQGHLREIVDLLGLQPGVGTPTALQVMLVERGTFFLCDTHVVSDPTAEQIADMTLLAAAQVRRFGLTPRAALLSHSNFGDRQSESALKMARATALVKERAPELEVDGEMHGDTALDESVRQRLFPDSSLSGQANLLIMPDLDAANIAFNLTRELAAGLSIGPLLLGIAYPATIVTPAATVRGIVNMTALGVIDAQSQTRERGALAPAESDAAPERHSWSEHS